MGWASQKQKFNLNTWPGLTNYSRYLSGFFLIEKSEIGLASQKFPTQAMVYSLEIWLAADSRIIRSRIYKMALAKIICLSYAETCSKRLQISIRNMTDHKVKVKNKGRASK